MVYDKLDNYEAWAAWQCVNRTNVNIFLTGNAGTGKTTFLKHLRERGSKRMVILAPTGVAAINAGGVTIHSFFQIAPSLYIPGSTQKRNFKMRQSKLDIIRSLDLLVIDEVSMVRADLLDCVDHELKAIRRNTLPFGGLQLLLVGDLRQLSPVVRPDEAEIMSQYYSSTYFFGSNALKQTKFYTFELRRIYRQHDQTFIDILNRVRENKIDKQSLDILNKRYIPNFNPQDSEGYIRLSTHNAQADNVNQLRLAMLDGSLVTYQARVSGTFPESAYPVEPTLSLKVGAQVMFLKNDSQTPRRYFNGKIGRVAKLDNDSVTVSCDDVGDVVVERFDWENIQYEIDNDTHEVTPNVLGKFSHIPLRLAWAITIHKSQGLTFDHAIIDAANSFSAGQVYVALSRCRSLEGLVLSSPISQSSIFTDGSVVSFLQQQHDQQPDEEAINSHVIAYAFSVAISLFNFRDLYASLAHLHRVFDEHCYRTYPKVLQNLGIRLSIAEREMLSVGVRFASFCDEQMRQGVNILADQALKDRVVNGAKYFLAHFADSFDVAYADSNVTLDNKAVADQISDARSDLAERIEIKKAMLNAVVASGFDTEDIMKAKTDVLLKDTSSASESKSKSASGGNIPADVANQELYKALVAWRREQAAAEGHSDMPYVVLANKVLIDIANACPLSVLDLKKIKGMGTVKMKAYADAILSVVAKLSPSGSVPTQPKSVATPPAKADSDKKIPSKYVSVDLFKQLRDVNAVASQRGMTVGTVRTHLFSTLDESGLTVADVIGQDRYTRLLQLLDGLRMPLQPQEKQALLDAGYDYSEFYFVLGQMTQNAEA